MFDPPGSLIIRSEIFHTFPEHECVPLVLLKNPDVLDDLLNNTPPGLIRVYSCDELERAIEACCRLEFRRQGITPEEITPGEVFVAPDR